MTIKLRQNTASQEIPLGYFLDSTDGDTPMEALTIANTDIKIWKTGATTLASKNSGGATHIDDGIYYATLDATDTNTLGPMVIFVKVAGALGVRLECEVLAANVYDSLIAGSDNLQVDTVQVGGTNQTAGDIMADTNDIQSRLPAALVGGRMDVSVGAMAADVVTSSALAAGAVTEIQSGLATASALSTLDGKVDTVDTVVDAIKAKTDNLPTDPADQSLIIAATDSLATSIADLPTNSELATALASSDDAVMARLGAPAGSSISADIAAVKGDTAAILVDTGTDGVVVAALSKTGYRLSAAGVDDILDETVETGATMRESLRLSNSVLGGKASGLTTTTPIFRDLADTKDRVTVTTPGDESGDRDAVTLDLT